MNLSGKLWVPPKESEHLKRIRQNAHRRERSRLLKELSPQAMFEREQRLLWFKLNSIFTHKEFFTYDSLPEKLKEHIAPFSGELSYPMIETVRVPRRRTYLPSSRYPQ